MEIQRKKKSDHTDDLVRMRKVTGYVKRHLKQKSKDYVENLR